MLKVCVVEIGKVSSFVKSVVTGELGRIYNWSVGWVGKVPVPERAYNSVRGQYNSTAILAYLASLKFRNCPVVLAITEVDIYATGLNFVFGEADSSSRVCVVSTFRLKPEFYGQNRNDKLYAKRIITEAIHEIGHVLGLGHCPNRNCVMFFSNSIIDSDRKGFKFCKNCENKIKF